MAYPYTIPSPAFQIGQPVVAGQHNANWNSIASYVNDISTGVNINPGVIGSSKIADGAIITTKIADQNVTSGKLQDSIVLVTPDIGVATGTSLNLSGTLTVGGAAVFSGNVAVSGNVVYNVATTTSAGSYTLLLTDSGKVVEISSAGTVLVPTNASVAFPVGAQIVVLRTGAGAVNVVGDTGVTVNATPGLNLRAQWSSATLLKRATDTWVLMGDLSA
jgi:hypothetical protein